MEEVKTLLGLNIITSYLPGLFNIGLDKNILKDPVIFFLKLFDFRKNHVRLRPIKKGSLAQLVQSICLTSRGSLVRTQ